MLVKADERFAALGLCEMEGIDEIHSPRHPIQCLGSQGGVFQGNARKPCEGGQRSNDSIRAESISSSQYPSGFEQNGRADEDVLAVDQRARLRELLRVVSGQITDDNISIDREHDAGLLRQL